MGFFASLCCIPKKMDRSSEELLFNASYESTRISFCHDLISFGILAMSDEDSEYEYEENEEEDEGLFNLLCGCNPL